MILLTISYDGRTTKKLIQHLLHTTSIQSVQRINYCKKYDKKDKQIIKQEIKQLMLIATADPSHSDIINAINKFQSKQTLKVISLREIPDQEILLT